MYLECFLTKKKKKKKRIYLEYYFSLLDII